jgi:hypothetical protein
MFIPFIRLVSFTFKKFQVLGCLWVVFSHARVNFVWFVWDIILLTGIYQLAACLLHGFICIVIQGIL